MDKVQAFIGGIAVAFVLFFFAGPWFFRPPAPVPTRSDPARIILNHADGWTTEIFCMGAKVVGGQPVAIAAGSIAACAHTKVTMLQHKRQSSSSSSL